MTASGLAAANLGFAHRHLLGIYHLEAKYVHPVDVSVEDAMRSIISCGAGSSSLLEKLKDTGKS